MTIRVIGYIFTNSKNLNDQTLIKGENPIRVCDVFFVERRKVRTGKQISLSTMRLTSSASLCAESAAATLSTSCMPKLWKKLQTLQVAPHEEKVQEMRKLWKRIRYKREKQDRPGRMERRKTFVSTLLLQQKLFCHFSGIKKIHLRVKRTINMLIQ